MKSLFLQTLCLLLFVGCSEEEPKTIDVNPVFQPYIDQFVEEAAKRGHDIDFSTFGLSVQFSDKENPTFRGRCLTYTHEIEFRRDWWEQNTEYNKEHTMFHELGHCVLIRSHKYDKLADGSWKSLMRGDPFSGIDGRIPVAFYGFRKDYYLDELFDALTPEPFWSQITYNQNQNLYKEVIYNIEKKNRVEESFSSLNKKYEFEVEFSIPKPESLVRIHWGESGNAYTLVIHNGLGTYFALKPSENTRELLHYNSAFEIFNGRVIDKITVRQSEGVEQIFINEALFFTIDEQSRLDELKVFASSVGNVLDNDFKIERFTLSTIE